MDPFTQRMMERARVRREKLDSEMADVGQTSDVKRRRVPLLEANIQSALIGNVEPVAKSPKRDFSKEASPLKSIEVENEELSNECKENTEEDNVPHSNLHSKLNRLGRLYTGTENLESLSSPVHQRTETLSRYREELNNKPSESQKVTSSARTARLAALARSIEEWEDDYSNLTPPPPTSKPVATKAATPVKAAQQSPARSQINSPVKSTPVKMPTRALVSSPAASSKPVVCPSSSPSRASPVRPIAQAGSPVRSVAQSGSPVRSVAQAGSPVRSIAQAMSPIRPITQGGSPVQSSSPRGGVQMGARMLQTKSPVRVTSFVKKATTKTVVWDQSVIATLDDEDDDYPGSPSTGSVSSPGWVYQAGSPVKAPRMGLQSPAKVAASPSPVKHTSPTKVARDPKTMSPGSVLQRAAMFETAAANCNSPDPAELSLAQRMALFEKNKSQGPLIPKVAFSTPLPAKLIPKGNSQSNVQRPEPVVKKDVAKFPVKKDIAKVTEPKVATSGLSKVLAQRAMFEENAGRAIQPTEVVAASLSERQKELEMLRSRYDKQKEMAGKPVNTPHEERTQMQNMRNRWESEKQREQQKSNIETPPPPPPMPSATSPAVSPSKFTSPKKSASPTKQYSVLDSVRKIRVSPPKTGNLYPCLSDIEMTESEMDPNSSASSQGSSTSFGDAILQAAGVNGDRTPAKRSADAMTPSECAVLNEIDEFLDQALESDSDSAGPTPPKKSKDVQTNDGMFCTPSSREMKAPAPPVPSYVIESGTPQPLLKTVSFYRKQKCEGDRQATPIKQVFRQAAESDSDEDTSPDHEQRAVHQKIKLLSDEVSKQQTFISQASRALNLCVSTVEFSNSMEQVGFERLLLEATHKRQALLNEIQRLKVEGTLHPHGNHTESGSLTISDISIPLKREFLARTCRVQEEMEQYIVCLVHYQEHVLASPVMATSSVNPQHNRMNFTGSITLQDLGNDFAIKLEVYTLQARRETISHEDKYHIKKQNTKMRLTPKKQNNLLAMPVVQSPAGPSAVRSPLFVLSGYTMLSLREISRSHFTLNKVPFSSPLEGHIDMKLSCELHLDTEQKGFLSMYDEISGYGAWHRRWCVLQGSRLSYWKYPDDEHKKDPIGYIELSKSITKHVTCAPQHISTRMNSFLVEINRPREANDVKSLVTFPGEQFTTLRHLLAADTKDERLQWCNELSRALSSMRAWRSGSNSQKSQKATAC